MAKTKTKPKKKTPNQVAAEAYSDEKYGPAISQVNAAFGTAKEQFGSDIDAAARGGESGRAYAFSELPSVQATYDKSLKGADEDNKFVTDELAKLGGAADVFKAAAVKGQDAQHGRIHEAGARAEQALRDRAAAATAGEQFAKNEARADYRKTTGALRQQLLDLKTQAGSAAAAKLSDLLQADLDRENKKDVATIGASATTDAATIRANAQKEKDAAKKKKDKKDVYGNTLDQRRSRRSTFKNTLAIAGNLKDKGDTVQSLTEAILLKTPTVNNTVAQAAADAALHGGFVSDVALRKALRRLGIMVTAPTPADRGGQRTNAPSNTPGQSRPT